MKFDLLEFQTRQYITEGSYKFDQSDVKIFIQNSKRGHYIGMSSVTTCGRLIWFNYHFPNVLYDKSDLSEQITRIFSLGHIIEDMVLQILILGGATISGQQLEFSDFDNKFKGHCDGIINEKNILEIKSMNTNSYERWRDLKLKDSHPTYYAQVNLYMHYSNLKDALLVAVNKNTFSIDCEHIKYDSELVNFYLSKIEKIASAKTLYEIKDDYLDVSECDYCPLYNTCWSV